MNTWNAELPPELPPPTLGGRIAGVLRMTAFIVLTAVTLAVFLTGRTLRVWLGRRVTYHFACARLWSRAGLWLTGLALVVRGTPVESGALVCNHCSWADILTLRSVRLMYFVAKAEVRRWPAVGFITAVAGTIYIERRRSQAKRQEQILRERIGASQLLSFFPEGTSTDGLRVLPFKSSLFSAFFHDDQAADLWIQPVTLRYTPAPGSGLPPSFYGWWGDMGLGAHIWVVMSRSFGGRAEVIFHQPVKPRAFRDRKALAEHCGAVVARGLTEG
ncbi:MAG: 1-acyl-sn-glycerol-3-phosphate acyltransferase [Proteobacteria bacterium]|nr:1-acyl-sn-glycerol-3-phosphate acyltransferase [Pseudomonadota bacterium]